MSDAPQQSDEVTRSTAAGSRDETGAAAYDRPLDGADEQIAFDLSAFPGGARAAIEAVIMVVDEPVTELSLASALELPVEDVLDHLHTLEQQYAAEQRGFTLR